MSTQFFVGSAICLKVVTSKKKKEEMYEGFELTASLGS